LDKSEIRVFKDPVESRLVRLRDFVVAMASFCKIKTLVQFCTVKYCSCSSPKGLPTFEILLLFSSFALQVCFTR